MLELLIISIGLSIWVSLEIAVEVRHRIKVRQMTRIDCQEMLTSKDEESNGSF